MGVLVQIGGSRGGLSERHRKKVTRTLASGAPNEAVRAYLLLREHPQRPHTGGTKAACRNEKESFVSWEAEDTAKVR